jgi:hypothetical protein
MKVSSKGIKLAKSLQRLPEVLFQSDNPLVGKSPMHSESSRCHRKLQLCDRRTSEGQPGSYSLGRKTGYPEVDFESPEKSGFYEQVIHVKGFFCFLS